MSENQGSARLPWPKNGSLVSGQQFVEEDGGPCESLVCVQASCMQNNEKLEGSHATTHPRRASGQGCARMAAYSHSQNWRVAGLQAQQEIIEGSPATAPSQVATATKPLSSASVPAPPLPAGSAAAAAVVALRASLPAVAPAAAPLLLLLPPPPPLLLRDTPPQLPLLWLLPRRSRRLHAGACGRRGWWRLLHLSPAGPGSQAPAPPCQCQCHWVSRTCPLSIPVPNHLRAHTRSAVAHNNAQAVVRRRMACCLL